MNVLEVKNLCKNYRDFSLKNVSFSLKPGEITGFIGRNGAGKTTTLKSLLNFVNPTSGEVKFFDKNFADNEFDIKQRIAFLLGGVNYYSNKKLKIITNVTKSFYQNWDNKTYEQYMRQFNLKENKTPSQLSEGMKVKYSLTLALSHNAELLILDEPTSGLDPVSRDEILEILMNLADKGITVLFSTHITSDLEKCTDNIIYIKNGEIIAEDNIDSFTDSYKVIEFEGNSISEDLKNKIIGLKRAKKGYTGLIKGENKPLFNCACTDATLEDIMVHIEKDEL